VLGLDRLKRNHHAPTREGTVRLVMELGCEEVVASDVIMEPLDSFVPAKSSRGAAGASGAVPHLPTEFFDACNEACQGYLIPGRRLLLGRQHARRQNDSVLSAIRRHMPQPQNGIMRNWPPTAPVDTG
jgi:hypothetical protein